MFLLEMMNETICEKVDGGPIFCNVQQDVELQLLAGCLESRLPPPRLRPTTLATFRGSGSL